MQPAASCDFSRWPRPSQALAPNRTPTFAGPCGWFTSSSDQGRAVLKRRPPTPSGPVARIVINHREINTIATSVPHGVRGLLFRRFNNCVAPVERRGHWHACRKRIENRSGNPHTARRLLPFGKKISIFCARESARQHLFVVGADRVWHRG